MNFQFNAIRQGFTKRAGLLLAADIKAAAAAPYRPILADVAKGLAPAGEAEIKQLGNIVQGHQTLTDFANPDHAWKRLMARVLSGDGELYHARKLIGNPKTDPNLVEEAVHQLGQTTAGRKEVAKKIGYGGAGAAGAGLLAYGAGIGKGQRDEDNLVGSAGNRYIRSLPLHKRLSLALSTVFTPGATGNKLQKSLQQS